MTRLGTAENAARENNLDPKDWTNKNISTIKTVEKIADYQLIGPYFDLF